MALYLGIVNNGTFVSSEGYTLLDSNSLYLTAIPATNKHKIILNDIAYRLNIKLPAKESE